MPNADTVQEIYGAFGRADISAILARLASSVEWEYGFNAIDVPWLQRRRGPEEVRAFFDEAVGALEIHKFHPKAFLESGNVVVVLADFEATVRATGRRIAEEDEVHIWYFDPAGCVTRFRHVLDTHQHLMAYKGH